MNKSREELMIKFQMYEQQIKQVQQQLEAIEQAIIEMNSLNLGLDELKGAKDKEILASVGKGIFIKAKILSEELTVDVGGKNFVKKDISSTKKLIEEQIKKLEEVKKDLEGSLEKTNEELTKSFMDAQGRKEGKSKN